MKQFFSEIFITPGDQCLRPDWRLPAHFMIFILLVALLSGILEILLYIYPDLNEDDVYLLNLLNFIAITLSVYLARRFFDRRSMTSLGLHRSLQAARELAWGIAIAALMMSGIFVALWLLGMLTIESFAWQTTDWGNVLRNGLTYLLVFIAVGWNEELLTRGYWLQNLEEWLNRPAAVLLTSLIFAALHAANPDSSWISTLGLFFVGLFLAYAYTATNRLWLPIGLHIGWNFFEGIVFGFPVSGFTFFQLIQTSVNGPAWLTGADFGPEAGLILLPALILGAFLISRLTSRITSLSLT